MPLTPNISYKTAVANEDARIFTKLFDNNNADITFSILSIIFSKYFALKLPFLYFNRILGFDEAVRAVSDPDKKPDIKTSSPRHNSSIIVISDIDLLI